MNTADIRKLLTEARCAGDDYQWLICERAIDSEFDAEDYTGGGHRISADQWRALRRMTQDDAVILCKQAIAASVQS